MRINTLQNPEKLKTEFHKIAVIFNIDKRNSNNNNTIKIYLFVNNFLTMKSSKYLKCVILNVILIKSF